MIQNLITLINKPAIELSVVDKIMIYGYAIAAGVILLAMIILILWIVDKLKSKQKTEPQLCTLCRYNKKCTINDKIKNKPKDNMFLCVKFSPTEK